VLAVDALERRAQRSIAPRAGVGRVGLELDADAAERLEGVAELQQLGLDVGARLPRGWRELRRADLQAAVVGAQDHVARHADRPAVPGVDSGEGESAPVAVAPRAASR
jgi:hypothetical protein